MFERFTDRARRAVAFAQDEARSMGHNFLGTEHLLLGLVVERGGVASRTLTEVGLDAATIRSDIREILGPDRRATDTEALRTIGIELDGVLNALSDAFGADRVSKAMTGGQLRGAPAFAPRAKKVMGLALREAKSLGHNYIGTEHLLLAIVREGNGVAAQILVKRTHGLDAVRDAVLTTLRAYPQSGT